MPFEQRAEFILEANLAMMFFLPLDVFLHGLEVGLADGKRSLTGLPTELLVAWPVRLHPF